MRRGLGVAVVLCGLGVPPHAGAQVLALPATTVGPAALPTLALDPEPAPSMWHGLSVGSEVIGLASKHGGGVGGDVFAAYDRRLNNNLVLGVSGATGYLPAWGGLGLGLVRGFDFAEANVLVGYDLGRVTPFVTAGGILARPRFGAGAAAPGADSLNVLMNGAGDTQGLASIGAGVSVAVTDRLSVTVGVNALRGRELFLP